MSVTNDVIVLNVQVRGDVFDQVPSGAHQGYAAMGSLYTQCRPLVPNLYGSLYEQSQLTPVSLDIQFIVLK